MARRAKTKVGGGPDARTMLAAGSRGRESQERAEAQQLQQIQQGGDRVAGAVTGAFNQGIQARQFTKQQEAQGKELEFRKEAETGRQMQTRRGQELQEAAQGQERVPGGDEPPLLQDERAKRVQAGMDQGTAEADPPGAAPVGETSTRTPEQVANLQAAGDQPVEIGAQGSVMPGVQDPQGKGAPGSLRLSPTGERRETRADYEAETRRMTAQARMAATQDKMFKAQAAGDKAGQEIIEKQMTAGLQQQMDLRGRIMQGKPNPNDFKTLIKWADEKQMSDNPGAADLMEILKTGAKTGQSPIDPTSMQRLQGFISAYMDDSGMVYTMTTGEVPGKFMDMSGAAMSQFIEAQKGVAARLQIMGPVGQQYMGIRTFEDKIRYLNRYAAGEVLAGRAEGPQDITGGMPAAGGEQPQASASAGPASVGIGGQEGSPYGEEVQPQAPQERKPPANLPYRDYQQQFGTK